MEEIQETVELPVFSIKEQIKSSAIKLWEQFIQVVVDVGKTPPPSIKISDSEAHTGHIVRALYAV